jgi:hypothetical protein
MGDDVTFNSISTQTISTATIKASTIYARTSISTVNIYADYLKGDGSSLTNLNYSAFNTAIPRTSYAPYSIPWNAMEDAGSIRLNASTWLIDGLIKATTISTTELLEASTINANSADVIYARIASLTSPVICSFLISTDTLIATNLYVENIDVGSLTVNAIVASDISANSLAVDTIDVDKIAALYGVFSTVSTGTWEVETIKSDRLQLLDFSSLTYGYVTLSANTLYLNNSSLLSNTASRDDLLDTESRLNYKIYIASNSLKVHDILSSMSSTTAANFEICQSSFSTLSTGIGNVSTDLFRVTSNLSISVSSRITDLSTYTNITMRDFSTTITNRLLNDEVNIAAQFVSLTNYIDAADTILRIGLSSTASNIHASTIKLVSTTSTFIGGAINTLTFGLSSVARIMETGISSIYINLSTQASCNLDTTKLNMSTAISNLSVGIQNTMLEVKTGVSTNASNISVMWGSVFSSLSTIGLYESVSSFSTVMGNELRVMSNSFVYADNNLVAYINRNNDILSTISGSNLSTLQTSVSSLSTTIGSNTSSLTSTIYMNYLTTKIGLSTLSTTIGSNTSSLTSTIYMNYLTTKIGLSTLSTTIGSNTSSLTESLQSTISNISKIENRVSTLSTIYSQEFSTLRASVSSLSTVINSNMSITLFYVSSISTNLNTLSNISLTAFSTLSTTIGHTSNYLEHFSSISTSIGSTTSTIYSVLALGISSISTILSIGVFPTYVEFSTQALFVSSISSANILSKQIFTSTFVTSTLSTGLGFFSKLQGSTMSSLTQQVGQLFASQLIASSFSGNLNDTTTVVIQKI